MDTWHFCLLNWQEVGLVWPIFISFVYTELLVWAFPQSHKLNLTALNLSCYLHFALFVLVVDQTQMYPSSILPLGLLQRVGIFEKSLERMSRFIGKIGGSSPYSWRGANRKKVKLCFSLVMYGFCKSNALYSSSLSFRILLLFRIKSQPGVAYKSVVYKKAFNFVFKSSKK